MRHPSNSLYGVASVRFLVISIYLWAPQAIRPTPIISPKDQDERHSLWVSLVVDCNSQPSDVVILSIIEVGHLLGFISDQLFFGKETLSLSIFPYSLTSND